MIGQELAAFDGRFLGIDLTWTMTEPLWIGPGQIEPVEDPPPLDAESVRSLIRRTAVAHELRHFHDFLLSPISSVVVRSRLLAAANALQLVGILATGRGGDVTLPIPIGRWLAMPAPERTAYLRRAESLFASAGRLLPPVLDLPFMPNPRISTDGAQGPQMTKHEGQAADVLPEMITHIAGQLARVDYVLGGMRTEAGAMYPSFPFEASGVIAQLQHIGLRFGPEAMGASLRSLFSQPRYGEVVAGVIAAGPLTDRGPYVRFPDAATLHVYALLGSCEPSGYYCQPVARMAHVLRHVIANGFSRHADPAMLFEEWDGVLDAAGLLPAPTLAGLESSLAIDAELEQFLPKLLVAMPHAELVRPLMVTLGEFVHMRRQIVQGFLADPVSYLHPGAYMKSLSGRPRPPVRVTVAKDAARACEAMLFAMGWDTTVANDHQVIAYPPRRFLPGTDGFQLDALDVTVDIQALTEMLFIDNPRVTEHGLSVLDVVLGDRPTLLRVVGSGSPLPIPRTRGEADRLFSRVADESGGSRDVSRHPPPSCT